MVVIASRHSQCAALGQVEGVGEVETFGRHLAVDAGDGLRGKDSGAGRAAILEQARDLDSGAVRGGIASAVRAVPTVKSFSWPRMLERAESCRGSAP